MHAGQQGVLLDILEVPQLMDICVRNGNYDDALDLRAFVAKLALIHPHLQVWLPFSSSNLHNAADPGEVVSASFAH